MWEFSLAVVTASPFLPSSRSQPLSQHRRSRLTAHSPAYIIITQIQGLPTMIFIGTDDSKPALRSEGLMTAETIKSIIKKDLLVQSS